MKKPSLKKLQRKLLTHHYGIVPTIIFYVWNPRGTSLDNLKKMHNSLEEIADVADFTKENSFMILGVTLVAVFSIALIYSLLFSFDDGWGVKAASKISDWFIARVRPLVGG
jgi:hypothetical protein